MHELFPNDEDARRLADHTVTLAELLRDHTDGWEAPHLGRRAVVQSHCHHRSVMGTDADTELYERIGLEVEPVDTGCCGLAGNFGFESGHHDVSIACAEQALLPAVRRASAGTLVIADGFSCRTQIEQLSDRRALHLAEVVQMARHEGKPGVSPAAFPERSTVAAAP